jgi:RNA polymerase sigma factor (sigma-70 family)
MSGDNTTLFVRECLKRMETGDESAHDELIGAVCQRMQQLAHHMLNDYSKLRRWEETDDVFSGAALRLSKALRSVTPESPQHFYRLAALQIRRELKELVRRHSRENRVQVRNASDADGSTDSTSNPQISDPSDVTHDPGRLMQWIEFHDRVEQLPLEQREVFEAIWYHQISQTDAAEALGISRRTVIRRWQAACLELHQYLEGLLPG